MRYCQPLVEVIGQGRDTVTYCQPLVEVIGQGRGYSEILPTIGRGYRTG